MRQGLKPGALSIPEPRKPAVGKETTRPAVAKASMAKTHAIHEFALPFQCASLLPLGGHPACLGQSGERWNRCPFPPARIPALSCGGNSLLANPTLLDVLPLALAKLPGARLSPH